MTVPARIRRGFTLIEMMVVVMIIGILLAIAALNYPKLLANIRLKACIANMRTVYGASQLALMENPKVANLTIDTLMKLNYLKRKPRCPYAPTDGSSASSVFYSIDDQMNKPLDVICVNTSAPTNAHGSLNKLLNLTVGPPSGGGDTPPAPHSAP